MLEHKKIRNLGDYFVELNSRQDKGVYFYRINGYSAEIGDFLKKYYDVARRTGVVIEGKIQNPDEKKLAYYSEIMGMDFQMNIGFITMSLKKWLPRMNDYQRQYVAASIYDSLDSMQKSGKTENMLKNAYIKFMCWLYYKFERIVTQLGENNIPKMLYEGDISKYELMLISILSKAGCDVVLLQYHGDEGYLKVDANSYLSDNLQMKGMQAWPEGFCIKAIRDELQNDMNNERLYGTKPTVNNCTNAWIKGKGLDDVRESVTIRGNDSKFFYNCFCRMNGVQDKLTYTNELFLLQQEIRNSKRKLVIVNEEIAKPTPEEIAGIKRGNYTKHDQMILDLAKNLNFISNIELKRIVHKSFVDAILAEQKKEGSNLNKLTNKAIYLLCWFKRYLPDLLANWKMPDIGCFIYMGGCKNDNEAMFLSFLARLPVDVLILCPNLNKKCCLEDKLLYEVNYSESLSITKYPEESSQVKIGTVAYHAERELDTLMYQDTGMYRIQQYGKANVISLQTMYEEIKILWDQELKYRPSFSTVDGVVNIPVVFAKISGVKDGLIAPYWVYIKELITNDTIVITSAPYIKSTAPNPMKSFSAEFFKNGKLQRNKIKNHPNYPYSILREDMQDFILDKLQVLIDQKLIRGIGENGTEYTVIAQVLNLPKDIVRMIQKFDFTKKNPKLIYINTTETIISLEDSILTAFLNLIGFDVIFFVPTGYQCIEKHFNKKLMEEHQIGEYKYDLQVPDLKRLSLNNARPSWHDKIFKRGNKYGT
ncbi:MAG: hypothetical protein GX299_05230 [Epulopiscium sp.]|jgi:hypothetical protein|nr:hypothetical protein [Candidatus Epulonipiscium sp.]